MSPYMVGRRIVTPEEARAHYQLVAETGNGELPVYVAPEFAEFLGPPTRLEFIRSLPCHLVLGFREECRGATAPDHVITRGHLGQQHGEVVDRANLLPLCTYHHERKHTMGIDSFAAHYFKPLPIPGTLPEPGALADREVLLALAAMYEERYLVEASRWEFLE